jgi:hypothetical protein
MKSFRVQVSFQKNNQGDKMLLIEKKKKKKGKKKRGGTKNSLWKNIWNKKDRGEPPLKPGDEGYPKTLNVGKKKKRKNESKEIFVEILKDFIKENLRN